MTSERDTAAWSLAEVFGRSQLCPSAVRQTALCARWAERGAAVRARLLERLDSGLVTAATTSVAPAWSQAAQVHTLGLGAAAYHYLAQPLPAGHTPRASEAETAGALTQLVVAFYDHLLDEGVINQPLRPAAFGVALRGRQDEDASSHPAARLVLALTTEWGRLVRVVGENDPTGVASLLVRAERMAVVEASTMSGRSTSTTSLAEQRARLPFEAVGAIARLARPGMNDDIATWHADWCGRVGTALGLVDDVVDLEEDVAAGRINRIAGRDDTALGEVVALLEALQAEWQSRADPVLAGDHAETLGMITRSWLAASMHERTVRHLTEAPAG